MSDDICEKVKEIVLRFGLIPDGGHVVVGLSGGPDSVCLFHVLVRLSKDIHFSVSAVHLNHTLRPGAAEEDSKYAEELAASLGVPIYIKMANVGKRAKERGETIEEAGREERYLAFREAAHMILQDSLPFGLSKDKIKIAVAHNRNDQAETMLMRILRGTGPDGLAGIPLRRNDEDGYEIIRPLLGIDRIDIEAYCTENGLRPKHDDSNDEILFRRNSIRLELIPFLEERFGTASIDALLRLGEIAAADKDYFDSCIAEIIERDCLFNHMEARIKRSVPKDLHPAIRRRLIIGIFEKIGLNRDISAVHLDASDKLLNSGVTGKTVEFPHGYTMEISYDDVVIRYVKENDGMIEKYDGEDLEDDNSEKAVGRLAISLLKGKKAQAAVLRSKERNSAVFDYDALAAEIDPGSIKLRTRKPGDRMQPEGMNGTKKIQDIFTDEKVPKAERDRIPMVASDGEILWIPGRRKSGKWAVSINSARVMMLEYDSDL